MSNGSRKEFHLPSLDGLRAVSFTIVFIAHVGYTGVPGAFGVTIFFFLSGYLITSLLRVEHERWERIDLKAFYLRRAMRILPPFYLVLFVSTALALTGVLPIQGPWPHIIPEAVLAQALHVYNYWIIYRDWVGVADGTGVMWSLAVEEHFYLLLPALFVWLTRRGCDGRRFAQVFAALCVAILIWRLVLVYGLNAAHGRTYAASDTRFDSLLTGCALAMYGNPALDAPGRLSERTWKWVLFPLGLAALLLTFVYRNEVFRSTFRYSIQNLALIPVFVVAVRYPAWGVGPFLNLRPLAWLGTMAFPLYLVHQIVIGWAKRFQWDRLPMAILVLIVSLAISWVIHLVVERPFQRLRRRISRTGAVDERIDATEPITPLPEQPAVALPSQRAAGLTDLAGADAPPGRTAPCGTPQTVVT